jgi:hypothetical protein
MGKMMEGQEDTPTAALMETMGRESPLQSMLMSGGGAITPDMLDSLLAMLNGKTVSGAGDLRKAIRSK